MGALHRFYIPAEEWDEKAPVLRGEEAHHCRAVLRHREGDRVEVFQGAGVSVEAVIRSVRKAEVDLEPLRVERHPPLALQVTLAQSLLKGKNMDWVVQKSAEIGVARFLPLLAERTVARLEDDGKKVENWRRVAIEACKQCGQNWVPRIGSGKTVAEWLASDQPDWKLVAALDPEARRLQELLPSRPAQCQSLCVAIGPEGDFTPEELHLFREAQVQFLSLGPTILRAETAAVYALSVISNQCF